jgi:hypothetical protein
MNVPLRTWLVAACALGASACSGRAEDTASTTTALVLDHPFVLAGDTNDVTFPWLARVVQDSLTVWLKDRLTGLPLVLDQRGLRHSVVGRIGDGPGELRLPRGIFAKGDSLAFSDSWRPNLELFDPQLRFVRTIPMPMTDLSQALFMRGDTVVGVGAVATEESFGLPFHVYAPNGRWVRSFGDANRNVDHDFMVRNRRVVASGTDSTFWSARYDSLVFEEWHISGGLVRSVRPSIPWLIPLEQDDPGLGQGPASAQIIDFRVTSPNGFSPCS